MWANCVQISEMLYSLFPELLTCGVTLQITLKAH